MTISGSDIYYTVRQGKNRIQPLESNNPIRRRQERLQRQMLLMMISSVLIFFLTTLTVNVRVIVATYQISVGGVRNLTDFAIQTAILTIFSSLNYAVSHLIRTKFASRENLFIN